jgi:hypothetical protein
MQRFQGTQKRCRGFGQAKKQIAYYENASISRQKQGYLDRSSIQETHLPLHDGHKVRFQ